MEEIFIRLAVGILLSVIRVVMWTSLDRLTVLAHLSTSRYHFEGVPGSVAPLLVTSVMPDLEKVTVNVGANFCTQSTDVVRGR
jgi:hypothetical protein